MGTFEKGRIVCSYSDLYVVFDLGISFVLDLGISFVRNLGCRPGCCSLERKKRKEKEEKKTKEE